VRRLPLVAHLAGYRAAHATGRTPGLPVNLTLSVTYSCASRCATCDIWQKRVENLTVDEYDRLLPTLERVPIWVTLSGGDQFLREDLPEIVGSVMRHVGPRIVNIPMNGVATQRIFSHLPRIAAATASAQLVLNLSVDEIGEAHDAIRGAPRNFEKLRLVADLIHDLQKTYPHVVLGVHTVISRLNVARVPDIAREVAEIFRPDSYITEVAENRVELGTMHKEIAPDPADYRRAVRHLQNVIRGALSSHPVARLVQALRLEYYDLAADILEQKRQVIDCYAGWSSAHVAPDGDVWGCCTRAESMGNVREHDHDFRRVWRGGAADAFRASVKARACACPLANASYTNLLLDAPSLARVVRNVAGLSRKAEG